MPTPIFCANPSFVLTEKTPRFRCVQVFAKSKGSALKIVLATADTNLQLSLGLSLSEEPSVSIVGTASEAESLLALIKFTRPDIVVADWDLPGRPISELLAEAQRDAYRRKLTIVCMSTRVREEALQAGATAFVVRGDPPEALLNVFRNTRALLVASTDEPTVTTQEE